MCMPVGILLRNIDSKEISEWHAYYAIMQEREEEQKKQQKESPEVTEAKIKTAFHGKQAQVKARKRR